MNNLQEADAPNQAPKASEIPEYHQSSINMFLKCPRQYMFRYEMNLVVPPRAALTVGKSVDAGITLNFLQKIESKTDLPLSEVLDAYSTKFDSEAVGTDWNGDDAGKQKDLGTKITKVLHEKGSPRIQPASVQEGFRIETDGGYALGGTFDVVTVEDIVRDTKSSKTEYDPEAVHDSIQATMYDYAFEIIYGRPAKAFAFDVGTKHKEPRYQEVIGKVGPDQRARLFEIINLMHTQIKQGNFQYAAEGAWWCSSGWCGYWNICKGKKS